MGRNTSDINNEEKIPLQLPYRTEPFFNRKREIDKLIRNIKPGKVFTLLGLGGIGKSAIVSEAVWLLLGNNHSPPIQFPDGIIYYNFYSSPESVLALEHIALSYGIKKNFNPFESAKAALSGRKALLILDGAEDADDLNAVLTIRDECGVIITSRKRIDIIDKYYDIEPLETDEAVKLLLTLANEQANDINTVRLICEMAEGHPLALSLLGRYLSKIKKSTDDYLREWLEETPSNGLSQRKKNFEVFIERITSKLNESVLSRNYNLSEKLLNDLQTLLSISKQKEKIKNIKIFICYVREDINIAKKLHNDLKFEGLKAWIDNEELLGGQYWKKVIKKSIRNSNYFLALISDNSISKKGFAQKELRFALDELEEYPPDEIFIIPIRIDDCIPNHEKLQELHWIDLFPDYEKGFNKVMTTVRRNTYN